MTYLPCSFSTWLSLAALWVWFEAWYFPPRHQMGKDQFQSKLKAEALTLGRSPRRHLAVHGDIFLLSQLGRECCLHLVGRGQGSCRDPTMLRTAATTKNYLVSMSVVWSLRCLLQSENRSLNGKLGENSQDWREFLNSWVREMIVLTWGNS